MKSLLDEKRAGDERAGPDQATEEYRVKHYAKQPKTIEGEERSTSPVAITEIIVVAPSLGATAVVAARTSA